MRHKLERKLNIQRGIIVGLIFLILMIFNIKVIVKSNTDAYGNLIYTKDTLYNYILGGK